MRFGIFHFFFNLVYSFLMLFRFYLFGFFSKFFIFVYPFRFVFFFFCFCTPPTILFSEYFNAGYINYFPAFFGSFLLFYFLTMASFNYCQQELEWYYFIPFKTSENSPTYYYSCFTMGTNFWAIILVLLPVHYLVYVHISPSCYMLISFFYPPMTTYDPDMPLFSFQIAAYFGYVYEIRPLDISAFVEGPHVIPEVTDLFYNTTVYPRPADHRSCLTLAECLRFGFLAGTENYVAHRDVITILIMWFSIINSFIAIPLSIYFNNRFGLPIFIYLKKRFPSMPTFDPTRLPYEDEFDYDEETRRLNWDYRVHKMNHPVLFYYTLIWVLCLLSGLTFVLVFDLLQNSN